MHTPTVRTGLVFALLQLFFTLTWTVYVIFLPQLVVQAGLPKSAVIWILLLDQLVFVFADWAMGAKADRAAQVVGRLGPLIGLITLVSAIAFLLLPFAAPQGSPLLLLALTLVWTITSSALRAPPLVLIGKYAAAGAKPWLSASWLFGLGVAGALAPYLTIQLRDMDPRLPFALSAIAVAVAAWGMAWAERHLASETPAAAPPPAKPLPVAAFLLVVVLVALGFQVHFALNSAPLYLRHATPAELGQLMPLFWVGFNLAMLPLTWAIRRHGDFKVMAAGALVGVIAVIASAQAPGLQALIAAQVIAGAAWAAIIFGAFGAAMALGHTGREGYSCGGMHAMFAVAALLRIGVVALQLHQLPGFASQLTLLPALSWGLAALLLIAALARSRG
ncbi:MAG: MFS transporter [Burkholderiales bacterium]|nr:MFS transporter [Burkholderiales bacterium]